MSWFGNTLIPVVQEVYAEAESFPADPTEVAADLRKAGYPKVAEYVEKTFTKDNLSDLFKTCGLVQPEPDSWGGHEVKIPREFNRPAGYARIYAGRPEKEAEELATKFRDDTGRPVALVKRAEAKGGGWQVYAKAVVS